MGFSFYGLAGLAMMFADVRPAYHSGKGYKRTFKKSRLTPKQKKAREKGKKAKQARKKNRENLVIQLKNINQKNINNV